jgi:hypothetical protein
MTFDKCLDQAKVFIPKDEIACLRLAGKFLEENMKNEKQIDAMQIEKLLEDMKKEKLLDEVKKEKLLLLEEVQKVKLVEEKEKLKLLLEAKEEFWAQLQAEWKERQQFLTMDALRARGLLSSRGIFESWLQLAHHESLPGKFNATGTCHELGSLTAGV